MYQGANFPLTPNRLTPSLMILSGTHGHRLEEPTVDVFVRVIFLPNLSFSQVMSYALDLFFCFFNQIRPEKSPFSWFWPI
jgi:hypothetical protein